MNPPVPVTLVTGFLGAGKTTLLNRILAAQTGRRFAIIENEFGDLGVDGSLVSAPSDAIFELNDGCVCCTVRDDLFAVFEALAARPGDFDHVIIETTGLADPSPVMRLFDRPLARKAFTLDGVVTVVDAGHIEQSLSEDTACAEQITSADLLILNKSDGLPEHVLEATENRLRQLNPLALILRAEHAQVDPQAVLNLGGRSTESSIPSHHAHEHHAHTDHSHQHDAEIQSVVVKAAGDIDVEALDLWLGQLTRRKDLGLLRMKGILAIPGHPRRFVFNGVRSVVDVRPDRPWGTQTRHSRAVFIGRGLDQAELQAGFTACQLTNPSSPSVT